MDTIDLVLIADSLEGEIPREQAAGMFAALAAHLLRGRGDVFNHKALEMLQVACHAMATGFSMHCAPKDPENEALGERPDVHAAVALFCTLMRACVYESRGEADAAHRLRRDALPLFKDAVEER